MLALPFFEIRGHGQCCGLAGELRMALHGQPVIRRSQQGNTLRKLHPGHRRGKCHVAQFAGADMQVDIGQSQIILEWYPDRDGASRLPVAVASCGGAWRSRFRGGAFSIARAAGSAPAIFNENCPIWSRALRPVMSMRPAERASPPSLAVLAVITIVRDPASPARRSAGDRSCMRNPVQRHTRPVNWPEAVVRSRRARLSGASRPKVNAAFVAVPPVMLVVTHLRVREPHPAASRREDPAPAPHPP